MELLLEGLPTYELGLKPYRSASRASWLRAPGEMEIHLDQS